MGAAVERCCRPTARTAGEQEGVGVRTGAKQPEGERRTPHHTLANQADREPPGRHESLSGLCSGCVLGMTREREGGEGAEAHGEDDELSGAVGDELLRR